MSSKARDILLLAVAGGFVAGALVTMWPFAAATKTNDLGYSSFCPFAPWSTLVLLAGGGLVAVVRVYLARPAK